MRTEIEFLYELLMLRDKFKSGEAIVLDKWVFKSILDNIEEVIGDIRRITECE